MKKIIFIALMATVAINAQSASSPENTETNDTAIVERNIRIEKEYAPTIQETKRQTIAYSLQNQTIDKNNIEYSTYAASVQPHSSFFPLEPQKQDVLHRKKTKNGYAAIGFGYPINWLAEGYVPIVSTRTTYFDAFVKHDGIADNGIKLINTDLNMLLIQNISRDMEFYSTVGYKNNFYNYYGKSDILNNDTIFQPALQSIHKANLLVGLNSTEFKRGMQYNFNVGYDMMYLQYLRTSEHKVNIAGKIEQELFKNKLIIDFNFNTLFYGENTNTNLSTNLTNNLVLSIDPSYNMTIGDLKVKWGAKINLSFLKGQIANISPDIIAEYNLGKTYNIYGGVTGNYKQYSLSSTLEECLYFNPNEEIKYNTYTPADFLAGIRIKPLDGLMIDFHANYALVYNAHFFCNKTYEIAGATQQSNLFTADYANMQHLNISARANYNIKDKYVFHLEGSYNNYNVNKDKNKKDIEAWHLPTWEVKAGTEINPVKNLNIFADFFFGAGYKTPIYESNNVLSIHKLNNRYDLNLGVSYTVENRMTIFIEGNNVLSTIPLLQYEDWYGYKNFGANVLLGVKVNF